MLAGFQIRSQETYASIAVGFFFLNKPLLQIAEGRIGAMFQYEQTFRGKCGREIGVFQEGNDRVGAFFVAGVGGIGKDNIEISSASFQKSISCPGVDLGLFCEAGFGEVFSNAIAGWL